MHTLTSTLRTSLAIAATVIFTACGGSHDHEGEDGGEGEETAHAHEAPNGGTLVVLDDHSTYAEFLVDAETGTMTMFTLKGHADEAQRSPTESVVITIDTHAESTFDVTLTAQANALSKETVGDSSKFAGQSDDLKGVDHFHGTIQKLTLKDNDYLNFTFDFPDEHDDEDGEDDHDEGDHDEGDHDHDDDDSEHGDD